MDEEVKYVRFQGYAHIGVDDQGRLTLMMCDRAGKPLEGVDLVHFSFIPGKTRVLEDGTQVINPPIKFLDVDLLAQFNQKDFQFYQPLWDQIQPDLTWENALEPNDDNMDHMNPTGPP